MTSKDIFHEIRHLFDKRYRVYIPYDRFSDSTRQGMIKQQRMIGKECGTPGKNPFALELMDWLDNNNVEYCHSYQQYFKYPGGVMLTMYSEKHLLLFGLAWGPLTFSDTGGERVYDINFNY